MNKVTRLVTLALMAGGVLVGGVFVFASLTQASVPIPSAPSLGILNRLTHDTHPHSSISASADASGLSTITYFHQDPFNNGFINYYVGWLTTNNGVERGVANDTTLTGNPFSDSVLLYNSAIGRYQGVYIQNGNIRWVSSNDGNTTWANEAVGSSGSSTSLDLEKGPTDVKLAVARNADGDSQQEIQLLPNGCPYMSCYTTTDSATIVADGTISGGESHSFSDVHLAIDTNGKYHLAYIEEWWKGDIASSVRRVVYKTNAGAGLTVTSADYSWTATDLALGKDGIALFGLTPYITYSQGGTLHVVSITGSAWTASTSLPGSQPSISGTSTRVDVAYRDANNQIVYIENTGSGWSSFYVIDTIGHNPVISVGGASTYVYYLRPTKVGEDPQTVNDEVFLKSNTPITDGVPPYVVILSPVAGNLVGSATPIYFQDQETTPFNPECSVDGINYHACTARTQDGTTLGDLPEFAAIADQAGFTLWVRDTDAAGNVGTDSQPNIIKDGRPPETTATVTSDGNPYSSTGWTINDVTVSLAAADPMPGSGMTAPSGNYTWQLPWTKYCIATTSGGCVINEDSDNAYSDQVVLHDDGVWYFRYGSRDVAGNIENIKEARIKIDKQVPNVNAGSDRVDNFAIFQNSTTSDVTSGIKTWAWSQVSGPGTVTFGSAATEDTTLSATVDGTYVIRLTVTDNALNANYDDFTFLLDTVVPTPTIVAPGYSFGDWTNQTVAVNLSCPADGGATCHVYSCVDTANTCDAVDEESSYTIVTEGVHYVRYVGYDDADNLGTVQSVQVRIDKTAPITSDDMESYDNLWVNTLPVGFNIYASDAGSDVATTSYCFSNSADSCDTSWTPVPNAGFGMPTATFFPPEGIYHFFYKAEDAAGNPSVTNYRKIKLDITKPVVTLNGSNPVIIEVGSTYTDAGVIVTDNYDNAPVLTTVNPVDSAKVGKYIITYSAVDDAGNVSDTVTRTVDVVDTTKPVITLTGNSTESISTGSTYTDAGATATDNYDTAINSKIVVTGSVNTAVAGAYTLTYNVTDAAGNAADAITRTVNVVAPMVVAINPPTSPTPVTPGTVLGYSTPVVTTIKASKSKYTLTKLDGTTVKVQPFEKAYKGGIWARRVNFGATLGSVYLFAPTDSYKKGALKVYGSNGTLLQTIKPYGGFSTSGFNLSIVVETLNDKVYLALGTKKAGTTVKVYEVQSTGLTLVSSLKAGSKSGNVVVKFLKLYSTQYGLATAINGAGIKVYKLNTTTNKFIQDKSYKVKNLKFTKGTIVKK